MSSENRQKNVMSNENTTIPQSSDKYIVVSTFDYTFL